VIAAELRPRGPYSLRVSGRHGSDATRIVGRGMYTAAIAGETGAERVRAWQRPDGAIFVRAESEAGVEHVRFVLGLEDDHSEFLRRFASDPLLGTATRRLRGLRPLRTATVAQSLLRAVAGQLVTWQEAKRVETAIVRAATPAVDRLHVAPTAGDLTRFAPPELQRHGLGARRAAALVRLCRTGDLERLKQLPTAAAARRLVRERGLGPWSVGVVCLEGLGRFEQGLARDLGLIKLLSALRGRWVEAEETDELLATYGEWAGLASVYLLAGHHAGLVPLPDAHRDPRHRQDRRVASRWAA
jgi:3-methyladenine DNA glycosylase/8-oxoguanine DNA glycosylase